jgi:hypothetical protein
MISYLELVLGGISGKSFFSQVVKGILAVKGNKYSIFISNITAQYP